MGGGGGQMGGGGMGGGGGRSQDTTRHALFLVTSRVEKFVGKTAVDTIAVRFGAIMSAVTVYVGTRLGWTVGTFATINAGLAAISFGFVILIEREHRCRIAAT